MEKITSAFYIDLYLLFFGGIFLTVFNLFSVESMAYGWPTFTALEFVIFLFFYTAWVFSRKSFIKNSLNLNEPSFTFIIDRDTKEEDLEYLKSKFGLITTNWDEKVYFSYFSNLYILEGGKVIKVLKLIQ